MARSSRAVQPAPLVAVAGRKRWSAQLRVSGQRQFVRSVVVAREHLPEAKGELATSTTTTTSWPTHKVLNENVLEPSAGLTLAAAAEQRWSRHRSSELEA